LDDDLEPLATLAEEFEKTQLDKYIKEIEAVK